jgi:hypothetical protein
VGPAAGSAELSARLFLGWFVGNGIIKMSQQLPRSGRILGSDYELHRLRNKIEPAEPPTTTLSLQA